MNKEQVLNSTFLPVEQKSPLSSNQVDLSGPYYHLFPKAYVGRQGLFNKRPYTALKETDQFVIAPLPHNIHCSRSLDNDKTDFIENMEMYFYSLSQSL